MKNIYQCADGLLYKSFSVIFMQTFTSESLIKDADISSGLITKEANNQLDNQLFTNNIDILDRYYIKGFNIKIKADDDNCKFILSGRVVVNAVKFFDNTILLSYRLIVSNQPEHNFCRINKDYISTDELILISGIFQHVEHWSYNQETQEQFINGIIQSIEITDMPLDENGVYKEGESHQFNCVNFDKVQQRYLNLFNKERNQIISKQMHYTLVDIWEDVEHQGEINFNTMCEDDIIQHIEQHHKAELVGLMSSYPREWQYRMESSYKDICGDNIAIDTDDLVLANPNMSIVFGTYGRRGEESPTDWKEHLARRDHYHTSWPEYLILLELSLASRQTINYVWDRYALNSKKVLTTNNFPPMIKDNAILGIRMTHMIMQLDTVRYLRYVSHKYMMNKLAGNIGIEEQQTKLRNVIKALDISLNNTNNMIELDQSNETKNVLWFISIASLFGVLMQNDNVPIISLVSKDHGVAFAVILNIITSVGIVIGLIYLVKGFKNYVITKLRNIK